MSLAVALLSFSGVKLVLAQDQTAQETPAATTVSESTDTTPAPASTKPLGTKAELKNLEEKNRDLETRLKALEDEMTAQKAAAATPATATTTPNPQDMVGPGGAAGTQPYQPGVHLNEIKFNDTNEYMYSESRYLSFSNPQGDAEFRLGGYVWTDLDINNQSFNVNSQGQTVFNYVNGNGAHNANNGGGDDTNGFVPKKAHLDFRASFDKMYALAIGLESNKSYGDSIGLYHFYAVAKFDKLFNLQFGKFSNPLSLEGLQPAADLPFVEASMIANFTVNKDIGAEVDGEYNHFVDYVLEIANGQQDNESSATGPIKPAYDMKALTARVFFTPWEKTDDEWLKGLGIGGGASVDNETFGPTSNSKFYTSHTSGIGFFEGGNLNNTPWAGVATSIGGNTIALYSGNMVPDGSFYHIDFQGYYYNGPFGFLGEHVDSIQSVIGANNGNIPATVSGGVPIAPVQLDNQAWLAEVQWVIGGKAGFEGAQVDNPFNPAEGKWGALELVGRVHCSYLDAKSFQSGYGISWAPSSVGPLATGYQQAMSYGIGFNWWLNENFKFMCDGEETDCSGGNSPNYWGTAKNSEQIMVARVALIM